MTTNILALVLCRVVLSDGSDTLEQDIQERLHLRIEAINAILSANRDQVGFTVSTYNVSHDIHKVDELPFDVPITHITYQGEVFFEFDSYVLKEVSLANLDLLIEIVGREQHPTSFFIVGHTDDQGDDLYNHSLSIKRAGNVAEYLVPKIPAAINVSTIGFGEAFPVTDNINEHGRELNRRVEFFIGYHRDVIKNWIIDQANSERTRELRGNKSFEQSPVIVDFNKEEDSKTGKITVLRKETDRIRLKFAKNLKKKIKTY